MRSIIGAVLCLAALGACRSDRAAAPAEEGIVGTYALETVDGQPVPYTWGEIEGYKVDLIGGALTLNEDQSFVESWTLRVTEGLRIATETDTYTGTYARAGNNLIQSYTIGGPYQTSSIDGNTITMAIEERFTAVFRR